MTQPEVSGTRQITHLPIDQLLAFKEKADKRRLRSRFQVLAVEDQKFSRQLIKGMLEPTYDTFIAADAGQGLWYYLKYAPDIALLDIDLPDMSGHRLAEILRAIDPLSFVIMVTANNYEEDVILAKKNGVRGFIIKPYNKEKFMEAIAKYEQHRGLLI